MSKSATSVFAAGVYHAVLGAVLVIDPNFLLNLLGFPVTSEIWVRVVGMTLFALAFYDIRAAQSEMVDFFRWTVLARLPAMVCFALFVLVGFAKPAFMVFGVVELLGALWTALALRSPKAV